MYFIVLDRCWYKFSIHRSGSDSILLGELEALWDELLNINGMKLIMGNFNYDVKKINHYYTDICKKLLKQTG